MQARAAAMLKLVLRILALVAGAILVLIGVAGLFLPFLQGVLLIILGLSLMSLASERAARLRDRLKRWARSYARRPRAGGRAGAEGSRAE